MGRLTEDSDEEEEVKRHTDLLPQKVDLMCQEVRILLLLEDGVDARKTEREAGSRVNEKANQREKTEKE